MPNVLLILATAALLTIHATHSYILLTANLEDVHAIAKQLANSPVADQLRNIWRRASSQFNVQVARASQRDFNKRANGDGSNSIEKNQNRNVADQSTESDHVERRHGDEASNASLYLSPKQEDVDQQ